MNPTPDTTPPEHPDPEVRPPVPAPAADEPLYTRDEVAQALRQVLSASPVFVHYTPEAREQLHAALALNIDAHVPARIDREAYLGELRTLHRKEHPAGLNDLSPELLSRAARNGMHDLADLASAWKARRRTRPGEPPEAGTGTIPEAMEVLYAHGALMTGIDLALQHHPVFGHYTLQARTDLNRDLTAFLRGAVPYRPYRAFVEELMQVAETRQAEPVQVLLGAAQHTGKALLGSVMGRLEARLRSGRQATSDRAESDTSGTSRTEHHPSPTNPTGDLK